MLTYILLLLVYGVVLVITSPLRLLGDVTMPAAISTTITSFNGYLAAGFSWLPLTITAALTTWGIFLTVETAIFLYKGFMWIIKKIPGIS